MNRLTKKHHSGEGIRGNELYVQRKRRQMDKHCGTDIMRERERESVYVCVWCVCVRERGGVALTSCHDTINRGLLEAAVDIVEILNVAVSKYWNLKILSKEKRKE